MTQFLRNRQKWWKQNDSIVDTSFRSVCLIRSELRLKYWDFLRLGQYCCMWDFGQKVKWIKSWIWPLQYFPQGLLNNAVLMLD